MSISSNKPSQQKLAQILADIIGDRYGLEIKVHVVERAETEVNNGQIREQ